MPYSTYSKVVVLLLNREFRANEANLMQSLNESRAQLREVRNQTLAHAQADEALMKSSEAAAEATANREELEAAREHNAAVELAREKYEVRLSHLRRLVQLGLFSLTITLSLSLSLALFVHTALLQSPTPSSSALVNNLADF